MPFKKPTNQPSQKVGLALGGGSTYGSAHIGVLKAFAEEGIPVDCVSGTSAGALVAAAYAFGMPLEEMIEATRNLNWRKLSRFAYSRLGLHSNKPMGAFITDILGDANIEDARIPLAITTTNIETHEMVVLRSGSLREAVRASTCIPGFFTPVEVDGKLLVDGGLTENVPLTALKDMGATLTIGVNLFASPLLFRPKNIAHVLNASITILMRHRDSGLLEKADILIQPELGAFDSSAFKDTEAMIDTGYRAAMAMMPEIHERLARHGASSLFEKVRSWFQD